MEKLFKERLNVKEDKKLSLVDNKYENSTLESNEKIDAFLSGVCYSLSILIID